MTQARNEVAHLEAPGSPRGIVMPIFCIFLFKGELVCHRPLCGGDVVARYEVVVIPIEGCVAMWTCGKIGPYKRCSR